jgi:hypothetical protein
MGKIKNEQEIRQRISILYQRVKDTMDFHKINIYMSEIRELQWTLGECDDIDDDEE